jgi:nucleoid-associated protein YgaU
MSKRDKSRFMNIPGFKESPKAEVENKTPAVPPDNVDVGKKTSFLAGFWEKVTTFRQRTWNWCRSTTQWIWGGLKKIPSYCVIRWEEKDEDEKTRGQTTPRSSGKAAPAQADKIDFDEDEVSGSRWWNLGIKAAAAGVAALVFVGGYFIATTFLKTPADTGNTETVGLTEQVFPEDSSQQTAGGSGVPSLVQPVRQPEMAVVQPQPQQIPPPPQGFGFDNNSDPFAVAPTTPAVAETFPTIASDPFGTMPNVTAEPPSASVPVVEPVPIPIPVPPVPVVQSEQPSLTALEPVQLEAPQPQLQPLVPLNANGLSPALVAAAPAAVNAPVAADYNSPRNRSNPATSGTPTPPAMNATPQMNAQRTIPHTEPVKEIVPQIPSSGTIENVPPPITPPPPVVAEPVPARSVYSNESAPAIPRDAPVTPEAVPVVVVPPVPATATVDSQPMDWQLWEHLHDMRNNVETEPSKLQLGKAPATREPALRFTSKRTEQYRDIPTVDELSPDNEDIAKFLPILENMPQPAPADVMPKYREGQVSGERGMTFQSRIDSEIKRSPSATETYAVQRGDTYMTISDKFYGTSLLYTALAAHNQKSGIGWRPAEGVVIEIPTAEYLRMHYGDTAHLQERRLELQRSAIKYIVQEGDTVFRLATDKLQDSTRWREIYALNADRIQDVRNLTPGTEILLPGL